MRRGAVALAAALAVSVGTVVATSDRDQNAQAQSAPDVQHHVVVPGESWSLIASRYGLTASQLAVMNGARTNETLHPSRVLHVVPVVVATTTTTSTTSTTTTTVPATTTTTSTLPSTTTTSTTTTTVAPTTTSTTVAPTTTTVAPSTAGFVEDFNGNADAMDRFVSGVFHRDNTLVAQTQWEADHALQGGGDCSTPDQTHTVHRSAPHESFYVCSSVNGNTGNGHLMTSVGDTSGYSIAWFSPDGNGDGQADVFTAAETSTVAWDVNVTNLGNRQWWEIAIVEPGTPFLTTVSWLASTANIEPYHPETIAVGKGPFGNDGNIFSGGVSRDPMGYGHVCGTFGNDPEGCASKQIRRPFWATDNGNGTISFGYLGKVYTYPGSFPDRFEVYFKDHNYTPNKDGYPVGHTWHWDNVSVS